MNVSLISLVLLCPLRWSEVCNVTLPLNSLENHSKRILVSFQFSEWIAWQSIMEWPDSCLLLNFQNLPNKVCTPHFVTEYSRLPVVCSLDRVIKNTVETLPSQCLLIWFDHRTQIVSSTVILQVFSFNCGIVSNFLFQLDLPVQARLCFIT